MVFTSSSPFASHLASVRPHTLRRMSGGGRGRVVRGAFNKFLSKRGTDIPGLSQVGRGVPNTNQQGRGFGPPGFAGGRGRGGRFGGRGGSGGRGGFGRGGGRGRPNVGNSSRINNQNSRHGGRRDGGYGGREGSHGGDRESEDYDDDEDDDDRIPAHLRSEQYYRLMSMDENVVVSQAEAELAIGIPEDGDYEPWEEAEDARMFEEEWEEEDEDEKDMTAVLMELDFRSEYDSRRYKFDDIGRRIRDEPSQRGRSLVKNSINPYKGLTIYHYDSTYLTGKYAIGKTRTGHLPTRKAQFGMVSKVPENKGATPPMAKPGGMWSKHNTRGNLLLDLPAGVEEGLETGFTAKQLAEGRPSQREDKDEGDIEGFMDFYRVARHQNKSLKDPIEAAEFAKMGLRMLRKAEDPDQFHIEDAMEEW